MVVEPHASTVAIKTVVKKFINGTQVARQHGNKIVFRLPSSESSKFGGKICYTN